MQTGAVSEQDRRAHTRTIRARVLGTLAAVLMAGSLILAMVNVPAIFAGAQQTRSLPFLIATGDPAAGFRETDKELAAWAFGAWQRESAGRFAFQEGNESSSRIRVFWAGRGPGAYGVTQQFVEDGIERANVVVTANVNSLGPDIAKMVDADPLMREVIVFLTCVHEIGHAIGLPHTDKFEDIMYSFQFGGDIPAYFGRFRNKIRSRGDIATASPFSPGDMMALRGVGR